MFLFHHSRILIALTHNLKMLDLIILLKNNYMLFTRREVRVGKIVPEVLDTMRVLKTEDTFLPDTDRAWLVDKISILFSNFTKCFPKEPR